MSHVLIYGTSLLAVTCPYKKSSGVAILVSLQECGFSRIESYTGLPTPESHRPKLGLRSTSLNAMMVKLVKTPELHYPMVLLLRPEPKTMLLMTRIECK